MGLGHKLDVVKNQKDIVILISRLKWLFITVWGKAVQPYATQEHVPAGFY